MEDSRHIKLTEAGKARDINFEACPHYYKKDISDEDSIRIAKLAVKLAREDFYKEVGETIVSKFFWLIGIVAVAAWGWASAHGLIGKE